MQKFFHRTGRVRVLRQFFDPLRQRVLIAEHEVIGRIHVAEVELCPSQRKYDSIVVWLGFSQLPRLYEEAMLIYVTSTRKPVNLHGRQISAESRQRFAGFNQVLNEHGKNKRAAYNKLAQDYRDSYFFYYVYGRRGTK